MSAVGSLRGRFQFVRFGTGPKHLVVLPGMALDNDVPGATSARTYSFAMSRLAVGRTVTVLHRPRGIAELVGRRDCEPQRPDTAAIADDYATAIEAELGPVDLMALSTGGLIGQHLAIRHPGLVGKLVLVVTGTRLGPAGREICEGWARLSRRQAWRQLRGELTACAVDGRVATQLARFIGATGRDPHPQDAADFQALVAAVLRHDTTGLLAAVTAPTLVLGGRDDPFFPEPVLRATAAEVPGALLAVHAGGHGVPKNHSRWLKDEITAFLSREQHDPVGGVQA